MLAYILSKSEHNFYKVNLHTTKLLGDLQRTQPAEELEAVSKWHHFQNSPKKIYHYTLKMLTSWNREIHSNTISYCPFLRISHQPLLADETLSRLGLQSELIQHLWYLLTQITWPLKKIIEMTQIQNSCLYKLFPAIGRIWNLCKIALKD